MQYTQLIYQFGKKLVKEYIVLNSLNRKLQFKVWMSDNIHILSFILGHFSPIAHKSQLPFYHQIYITFAHI